MTVYLQVVAGFALLMVGGDWVVRASVRLAGLIGLTPLVVSVVIIGFGTSLPELLTSVDAALVGSPGIAIGNVIGSNIANVLLILGAGALMWPIVCDRRAALRDGGAMLAVSVSVALVIWFGGGVDRWVGVAFVVVLVSYLGVMCVKDRNRTLDPESTEEMKLAAELAANPSKRLHGMLTAGAAAVVGLAAIAFGAYVLVESAIELARRFGVPETVIGLTVIAVGSSLPELAATIVAALRKHADVAFGNILGSNLFNLLGVLGVTASIRPITTEDKPVGSDLLVMLAAAVVMLVFALTGRRITRGEGALMMIGYAAYIALLARQN